jgi:4-hydroxythreonine-4-phosphate dehydrogenase
LKLAITVGDPRGIGPEVVAAALADPRVTSAAEYVVIGSRDSVAGLPAPDAGRRAGEAVVRAVELALAGEVDGIVTAPLDKAALLAGGYDFPGHTEMLAALTGSRVAMMLASDRLRVVLATTHIPLREVPRAVTKAAIVETAQIARRGLRDWFGIAEPRLALCALNPHAGDGGRFGDEDDRVLLPAAR